MGRGERLTAAPREGHSRRSATRRFALPRSEALCQTPSMDLALVAHRGYPHRYPDNTLVGVRAALDAGARFLEVDVQVSRDLTPYLMHDADLTRVCGVEGSLEELGDAEVGALRAAESARLGEAFADEPVARLAELAALLREHARVFTFVEIKPIAVEQHGVDAVVEAVLRDLEGLEERIALISFDLPTLAAVRARGALPIGPILHAWSDLEDEALRALVPEFVFSNTAHLPEGSLAPLPGLPGAALVVYEVVDPSEARDLFERGVRRVETFQYPEMQAALADLLEAR